MKELELYEKIKNLSLDAEENRWFVSRDRDKQFYLGKKAAYDNCIKLLKENFNIHIEEIVEIECHLCEKQFNAKDLTNKICNECLKEQI